MKDTMIGVNLAKRVFQVHGASMTGQVMFRKKLTWEQFGPTGSKLRKWPKFGTFVNVITLSWFW